MAEDGFTPFRRVALIGIGLINASIAHCLRRHGLAGEIVACAKTERSRRVALDLGIADSAEESPEAAVRGADLVILGVPVGAMADVIQAAAPGLAEGAIVTDVGSVKQAVIRDVTPAMPEHAVFVPGHPVAGTEHSGPEAGFAELFDGRWTILTPLPGTPREVVDRVAGLWKAFGSLVVEMESHHHDQVLAVTSHLPHLIAYTIVDTAMNLETTSRSEVVKFSAGGFRDFTRIAASDPVMWRDVFLNNREAVLEMLQRFSEDLTAMQRAIRWGEGDTLEEMFTRTRAIRRGIIEAKQA